MHLKILSLTACLLYLTSSLLLILRLNRTELIEKITSPVKKALSLAGLGSLLYAYILVQFIFVEQGIQFNFYYTIAILSWWMAGLLIFMSLFRPLENLGILFFPIAGISVVTLSFLLVNQTAFILPWQIGVHALLSILAYSILALAVIQALALAWQDQHLHNHQPNRFTSALPPLHTMEELLFELIRQGFIFLSFSLISGMIYLENIFAQHLAHKTLLSIMAWMIFATLIWGRWRYGWRGKSVIRSTLAGFMLLMLGYLGSKFILEVVLV